MGWCLLSRAKRDVGSSRMAGRRRRRERRLDVGPAWWLVGVLAWGGGLLPGGLLAQGDKGRGIRMDVGL